MPTPPAPIPVPSIPPEFNRLLELVRTSYTTKMLWDQLHPYNNCDCAERQYTVQTMLINDVEQVDAHYPTCPIGKWQELGRRLREAGLFAEVRRSKRPEAPAKGSAKKATPAKASKPAKKTTKPARKSAKSKGRR